MGPELALLLIPLPLPSHWDLAARDLAKKQFECLLSETKHDQQVFEIYLQNRANHTVNVQGIAVQYQKKLSDEARAAVEKWWDKHVLGPV